MIDTTSTTSRVAAPFGLGRARWTRGFWADRFATCRDVTVPTMGKLMTDAERVRWVGNFEVANGSAEGRHRGPRWNDGDFYKWLEAAASLLAYEKDEKLAAELDELIELIAKTQEPDGYIHTDVQIAQRTGRDLLRFANPMDFEMYNMGHLITAACVHHAATGKANLLSVGRKAADYLAKEFEKPTQQQARHGICPSHLMALVDLGRATNEPRYAELAKKLLDMRDLVASGDDDNQDRVPLRKETRAVGHAVRGTYLWAGAADVIAETGDESLRLPLERIWTDLVTKKLYITGGCGALFDGASPDGAVDQASITRVHQAFGRDYQLPHTTAHNETCAAIGNVLWNWRMFQLTADAKYCDVLEHALLNSVLAGASLAGDSYFYTNTLRRLSPMPVELRWPAARKKTLGCMCCPPNLARTVAQSSVYAYAASERGTYVVLYGGSTLKTGELTLTQSTNYPWDGQVRIAITAAPGVEHSLFLRVPGWARGATVRVNGARVDAPAPQAGTFFELRGRWNPHDVVEVELPMPVRLIEANPYVEEARNHVAVMRGPIVYCLESNDLPEPARVLDVHLPRDARFSPRATDELGGVTVLEGNALARESDGWSGQLYRDLTPARMKEIPLALIPYFAWDNRGDSEMTVWLPLA
jgi:uncharacterized protein